MTGTGLMNLLLRILGSDVACRFGFQHGVFFFVGKIVN